VRFFLAAVLETANDALETSDKLIALREKNINLVQDTGRSAKTATSVFLYLEQNPIIDIQKTAAALGLSFNVVSDAVRRLCAVGILAQPAGRKRNRVFSYEGYLEILRNGT
jgi:Fic family protein